MCIRDRALAIALNQNIRWKNFYRSAYFIPSVTSIVVLSLIFTNLFSHDGYLNSLLKFIGIPYPKEGWLMNTGTALLAIMGMDVWIAIGYYVILFLAALQTIPSELYEASSLDCLLYTSPSPRDRTRSRMPSSA